VGVADLLRRGPGLPPEARLRDPERSRRPLSRARGYPAERLAPRRGSPPRPGQRRRLPCRQGLRGDDGQPGRLPGAAACDLQADLQRDVPRSVDAGRRDAARDEVEAHRMAELSLAMTTTANALDG